MLFSHKKVYHAYMNTKLHVDKHAAITIISPFLDILYENISSLEWHFYCKSCWTAKRIVLTSASGDRSNKICPSQWGGECLMSRSSDMYELSLYISVIKEGYVYVRCRCSHLHSSMCVCARTCVWLYVLLEIILDPIVVLKIYAIPVSIIL